MLIVYKFYTIYWGLTSKDKMLWQCSCTPLYLGGLVLSMAFMVSQSFAGNIWIYSKIIFCDLWPPQSFKFSICKSLYHSKFCKLYIWTMSLKSRIVKWGVFTMDLGVLLTVWKILLDQNRFPSLCYEIWTLYFQYMLDFSTYLFFTKKNYQMILFLFHPVGWSIFVPL